MVNLLREGVFADNDRRLLWNVVVVRRGCGGVSKAIGVHTGHMRICFVCLGNICRSPAAEAVFVHQLAARNDPASPGDTTPPAHHVESAGTAPWHIGNPPHERTMAEAAVRGIAIDHRGQQFTAEDFDRFDLVVAMDSANVSDLLVLAPNEAARAKVRYLKDFAPGVGGQGKAGDGGLDVPDPYGLPQAAFATMFDQVEQACAGLLDWLAQGAQD